MVQAKMLSESPLSVEAILASPFFLASSLLDEASTAAHISASSGVISTLTLHWLVVIRASS
jgi:hypothetical protein